eukprot:g6033.t1
MGAKKKVTVIFVGDDSRAPVPQNMLKEDVVPYLENWWVKKPMRKGLVVPSFWNAYKWSLKILQETAPDDFSCFPPSVLSHYRIDMIGSLASAPTKTGNFFPEKKRKRVHDAGASGTQGAGQSNDSATKRKKSSTTESDVQNCNAKKRGRLSAENGAAQEEASKSTNDPVAKEGDDRRFSNGSRFLSERGADLQFPIEACVCNISYNLVKGVYAAKPTDSIKRRVEFSALKKWRRHGFRNKLSWKKLPLGTFANMTYASRGRDLAVYLLDQIFNVADTDRGNDIYAIENFEECIEQFPPRYFDCTKFLGLGTRDQTDSYFVKLVRYAVLWTDKVANKDSQLFTHFSKQSLKTLVKDQEQLKKLCTKLHHEFCQRNLSSRGLWLLVQYAKWFGSSFRRKVNSEMKGRGVDVNLSQVHQTKTFIKERYNPAIGETRQGLTITPGETVLVLQKDKDFWLGKNSSGSFGWFPASCVTELQDAVDESESSSVEGKPPQSFATDGSVDTDLLRPPNKVRVRKSYFENILDMEFKALPRRNHQANEVPAVFLEPEQVQIA